MQANRLLPTSVTPFLASPATHARPSGRFAATHKQTSRQTWVFAEAEGGFADFTFDLEEIEKNTGIPKSN